MAYLYESNISATDRFDRLQIRRDDGSTAIIRRGHSYDLTAAEADRVRRFAVLTSTASADEDPVNTGGGGSSQDSSTTNLVVTEPGAADVSPSSVQARTVWIKLS